MSVPTPRVRVFAGPNGSGESTLKSVLLPRLLGVYLNPDEIEMDLRARGALSFEDYGVVTRADEFLALLSVNFTHSREDFSNHRFR